MMAKKVTTIVLLAFVAASVVYLVYSESGTEEAKPAQATTGVSTGFGVHEAGGKPVAGSATTPGEPAPDAEQAAHKVIAYYFHSTQRCATCLKIERLAEAALREQFAAAFESGQLEWHAVNMEESPNEHFVHDYQLVTSSLVLVDLHDDEQRDWTEMEKVWEYVHDDEAAFKQYVAQQAREYLES